MTPTYMVFYKNQRGKLAYTADDALAYALDRWLPGVEPHEIEHVRERLRERGFDVLGLVQEVRS